jgi:hypothetical protein
MTHPEMGYAFTMKTIYIESNAELKTRGQRKEEKLRGH